MDKLTRRTFLKGSAATGLTGAAMSTSLMAAQSVTPENLVFKHGVASGDPTHTSVIIWTRVTSNQQATVIWKVAKDAQFKEIIDQGEVATNQAKDFTVKVDVKGLKAGQSYYYQFFKGDIGSDIGRTKTLPEGHLDKLAFAVASCSNYPFGYFNAYQHIADDAEIDFVLHLGDYIYEYGQKGWGAESGKRLGREHQPAHEIVSLSDYRTRHAQYKSDPASRAMHAAHPLIPTWDDHESANNPYIAGAQNHQENEGDWIARRNASIQAYYEWMPIREPEKGGDRAKLWRHFSFGNLASLTTLETRHTARAKQIEYADHLANLNSKQDRDRFMAEVIGDPNREMLSAEMRAFVKRHLTDSVKRGQPWRLIGNQIPMARTHVPSLKSQQNKQSAQQGYDPVAEEHAQFKKLGDLDLPIYLDTWDGYGAARDVFYQDCQQAGASDLVVLTGDSHAFWANQLFDKNDKRMGIELGTTSITSPGDFESYGKEKANQLDKMMYDHNREVIWTDCTHRGYIKVTLTPEQGKAEFVSMNTIYQPDSKATTAKAMQISKTKDSVTLS